MKVNLNRSDIINLLPQKDPFLFVDGVSHMVLVEEREDRCGSYVRGFKNVQAQEYYFKGHFPNEPLMPGVLVVEAIAQLGICMLSYYKVWDIKKDLLVLTKIDNFKFRHKVAPGDVLFLEAKLVKQKMNRFFELQGTAEVNGLVAATGRISCMLQKNVK